MEYIIKYYYNGEKIENIYVSQAFGLDIFDIAKEALLESLKYNNLQIENNCLKNIELFQVGKDKPIYSATTYTLGMGFIIKPEDE